MKNCATVLALLTFIFLPLQMWGAAPPSLATYKAIYEQETARIKTNNAVIEDAAVAYLKALDRAEADYKKAGDFPGTKAVRNEIKRFGSARTVPDEALDGTPDGIAAAQAAYRSCVKELAADRNERLLKLTQRYVKALRKYTATLLEQDKMDAAEEANKEIQMAEALALSLDAALASKTGNEPAEPKTVKRTANVLSAAATVKGKLTGVGEDGRTYTMKCNESGTLAVSEVYNLNGMSYLRFKLNGMPWPENNKGMRQDSWSFWCEGGAVLSGVGGDGKRYSSRWTGAGTLRSRGMYNLSGSPFVHFSLNGAPWPDVEWGVALNSLSITFEAGDRKSWNALNDFNSMNIEGQPWCCGWLASTSDRQFHTFKDHTTYQGNDLWHDSLLAIDPNVRVNRNEFTSFGAPTGAMAFHPGYNRQLGVVRWISPCRGNAQIRGAFGSGDKGCVDVIIMHNQKTLFRVMNTPQSEAFSLDEKVSVGDTIDFMVGAGMDGFVNDSTPLDAAISFH